jgi:hypothetical protein
MLARGERKRLLAKVVDLYAEGEIVPGRESAAAIWLPPSVHPSGLVDEEQQAVIDEVRQMLAEVLVAVRSRSVLPKPPPSLMTATIGGAEMVAHSEILAGSDDWLTTLLPSFTYLATLPYLDRDQALELADRVRELAEKAQLEARD